MLDLQYRCIFIPQRRAAGTAIIKAFGKTSEIGGLRNPGWHAYNDGVLSSMWRVHPPFFVFSAVRNPFDRLVSGWKMLGISRNRSLRDVLENPPVAGYGYQHLVRQQVDTLRSRRGRLVTHDLVRYESLQADFDRICDRLGKPRVELTDEPPAERANEYRDYFDDRSRALAEKLFADDLRAFGYSF